MGDGESAYRRGTVLLRPTCKRRIRIPSAGSKGQPVGRGSGDQDQGLTGRRRAETQGPVIPCLDCRKLCNGTRCKSCQRLRERSRPGYRSAYQDTAYRAVRTALRGSPCVLCGLPGSDSVGHAIPLAKGGTNHPANLVPEHLVCPGGATGNLVKGAS